MCENYIVFVLFQIVQIRKLISHQEKRKSVKRMGYCVGKFVQIKLRSSYKDDALSPAYSYSLFLWRSFVYVFSFVFVSGLHCCGNPLGNGQCINCAQCLGPCTFAFHCTASHASTLYIKNVFLQIGKIYFF